jgi:2-amino-4-hydroxy-6-hydroxymethyldihydropteridine diphosphokinase
VDCPPGSADFVNAVVSLLPPGHFTPSAFLHELKALEAEFGRKPKLILNEARPLDLDLIAWGATSMQTAELTLPHPRAHLRNFVLAPLSEIAPELVLPGHEKPVSELLANLRTGETIERI